MASTMEREFSFCDRSQNDHIVSALFEQKQSATFCDVIMKVCGREIFAHSVILAAASPYFGTFLTQDLPRLFSQKSPQVIEIQIDGSEPDNMYKEAVSTVVDYIYTGKMIVKQSNVSQVYEIGRIMQMDKVVKCCSDFLEGKLDSNDTASGENDHGGIGNSLQILEMEHVVHGHKQLVEVGTLTEPWDTVTLFEELLGKHPLKQSLRAKITGKMGDPAFQAKIKAKQLVSVSCQVYPHLLPEQARDTDNMNMKDQASSTDNRYFETLKTLNQTRSQDSPRNRKRKAKDNESNGTYKLIHAEEGNIFLSTRKYQEALTEHSDVNLVGESLCNQEVAETVIELENVVHPSKHIRPNMEFSQTVSIPSNLEWSNSLSQKTDQVSQVEENPSTQFDAQNTGDITLEKEHSDIGEFDDCNSTNNTNVQTPRRSSRRSKPTSRMQEFHNFQELHGSQLRRVKQEIMGLCGDVEIVPDIMETVSISEDSEKNKGNHSKELCVKHDRSEQEEAAVRLLSLADHIVQKPDVYDEHAADDEDGDYCPEQVSGDVADVPAVKQKNHRKRSLMKMTSKSFVQIGLGKYQCDICEFNTNKVRQMSAHIKLHKLECNICYYCEQRFENKETLADHMDQHKGPVPFFCHVCGMRFKSRTLLNMHLPKHSDDKPFICHVCCMGFKWKHALKTHMITHTNKKEHLCDICGYATAHKSQLKAHRKIHSGDMLKCHYPDCDFLATKTQNMKYHLLTHTKEKAHQCDICGQKFSLVKNLRRHLMLHSIDKKQTCAHCSFNSTRVDKLKEHMLKMHGLGTPPERRLRVTDMVINAAQTAAKSAKFALSLTPVDAVSPVVKVEPQLIEHMKTQEVSVKEEVGTVEEISQFAQELMQTTSSEATLIEIIQENGQPMRILRNQPILITHPDDSEGTSILQHMGGVAEVVNMASVGASQGLVISEPNESTITTIGQNDTSTEVTITCLESTADGLAGTRVITSAPGIEVQEIQGMNSEHVTYAEMVEVPVEHVAVYGENMQNVNTVQIE